MDRQALNALIGDLADIVGRVRDLEADVPMSRAACLHSLAEAIYHLQRCKTISSGSIPPGRSEENRESRNRATESFQRSRELLKGVK